MTSKKYTENGTPVSAESELQQRRDTVKKILLGGGIVTGAKAASDEWTKPVIDKVFLPAHAQTTGSGGTAP